MKTSFKITKNKETFELDTIDDLLKTIKEKNIDVNDPEIIFEKITSREINSSVLFLIKDELDMEEIRKKNRIDQDLKQFNSVFMKNDFELPYDFDLVSDIKSEGHIAYLLYKEKFLEGTLIELCLNYGITNDYLEKLIPQLNKDI